MSQLSLHLQVLVHLRDQLRRRKAQLEERCGKGLPDQDYQRVVGGIREHVLTLESIEDLMKSGLSEVEDHEDLGNEDRKPARRSARRPRTTQ